MGEGQEGRVQWTIKLQTAGKWYRNLKELKRIKEKFIEKQEKKRYLEEKIQWKNQKKQ